MQLHCYIHSNKNRSPPSSAETSKLCSSSSHSLSVVVFPTHCSYLYHKNSENLLQGVWPTQNWSCWTSPLLLLALVSLLYFVKNSVKLQFCAQGVCCLCQFWGPSGKVVEVRKPGCCKDHSAAFHTASFCTPVSDIYSFEKLCYKRSCIFLALFIFTGSC